MQTESSTRKCSRLSESIILVSETDLVRALTLKHTTKTILSQRMLISKRSPFFIAVRNFLRRKSARLRMGAALTFAKLSNLQKIL
ncbi:hypothetical protein X777_11152 [Ooceraea biroi]|uniref:Uncharacterized protein n=1 Tax=Ooceraea biroi TaxID=2015173 RepID=A0A026W410_OOCBI|nr:hypothetical protein X777_11152 [Ooceraea biroi]